MYKRDNFDVNYTDLISNFVLSLLCRFTRQNDYLLGVVSPTTAGPSSLHITVYEIETWVNI